MRLIGMLDSPYVRRVAISFEWLGVPFRHEPVSVFNDFGKFQHLNPVVKAPTLICDDGEILMDSSLILQYVETTKTVNGSLWPRDATEMQHDVRAVGLALAACEKSAQMIYEQNLRPPSARYQPWLERVAGQLHRACEGLEREVQGRVQAFLEPHRQASISAAVAWQFMQSALADVVPAARHPGLVDLSGRMECTPAFRKYPPVGPGVQGSP